MRRKYDFQSNFWTVPWSQEDVITGDHIFVSGSDLIIRCPPSDCLADISLFLGRTKASLPSSMRKAFVCLGKLTKDGRLYDTLKMASDWIRKGWLQASAGVPSSNETDAVQSQWNRRAARSADDYWYSDDERGYVYQRQQSTAPPEPSVRSRHMDIPFFNETYQFYQLVLVIMSALLAFILILQYCLLWYMTRMRENYVLLSRSALYEDVDETETDTDTDSSLDSGTQQKSEISSSRAPKSSMKTSRKGKSTDDLINSVDDNVPSELKSKRAPEELKSGIYQ
ncbi:hypothetical protein GCK32_012077 [Trichostrongylus colubriformis]|uniref:Uncharacterized protein n=1 Tax=Trichostrongylus colubriformis TaxID=6319 RepID=A0AAN8FH51_TRICO